MVCRRGGWLVVAVVVAAVVVVVVVVVILAVVVVVVVLLPLLLPLLLLAGACHTGLATWCSTSLFPTASAASMRCSGSEGPSVWSLGFGT